MIDIGIDRAFSDTSFIQLMKDYRKMSRTELVAWIGEIESRHAAREKAHRASSKDLRRKSAADLRDREARLRAILETAVEGIITIDDHGFIESVNTAAEEMFGYRERELAGKNVSVLMPSPHREEHDNYLANYLRTGRARIIGIGREVSGRRKDGSLFPMDLSVSEVRLVDRRIFTGFVRDITARKEAEKVWSHYAALVKSSDDAIIGKSLDGRVTSWNRGAQLVFGYTAREAVGKHISFLIPSDRQDEEPRILEKIKRGESVDHYETVRRRKDGKLIDISVTVSPIRDSAGNILGASKVARDITDRKRLEKEILEISAREQRRIGQDLHDGLCQQLAGIALMSEALEENLAQKSKATAARVGEIAAHIRDAISHTRQLARGLAPVTLETEGLMSALQELASNTEKIFRVECRFAFPAPIVVQDQSAATQLYRIAQEAVSNAVKHGKAKRIVIQLKLQRGKLLLSITDNGCGFPKTAPKQKGMGLQIMRSRARMIGGTLAADTGAAGGVQIVCSAPFRSLKSAKNQPYLPPPSRGADSPPIE